MQPADHINTQFLELLHFPAKTERINDHPLAEAKFDPLVLDARRDQMQNQLLVADLNGVAGVGTPLKTDVPGVLA
jgi:hypothetical protein